ncbi:MAG TPA: hypothetical protein PLZ57_04880 [Pseudobdellovibrionaceae bacterium]|nr:hypothetical protein [Pseudobdellovibrionaceae bacterium]
MKYPINVQQCATAIAISMFSLQGWAEKSASPKLREVVTLEFPTKTFYIHAPEYTLPRAQVERELNLRNGHGIQLFKLFDFTKSVFKKGAGEAKWNAMRLHHVSGEVKINPSLKMVGNCVVEAQDVGGDSSKLRYSKISCYNDGEFNHYLNVWRGIKGNFEYEGLTFRAIYEAPEDIPFDPKVVNYCEGDGLESRFPTIFIKDYLTTRQIWIEKEHVTKNGKRILSGENLECRPDRLNPDGIVRCTNENSIADKPECSAKPFFLNE